jgi:hypothetical protein
MRHLSFIPVIVLGLFVLSGSRDLAAMPISADAAEACKVLGRLLAVPRSERRLTDADRARYVELARRGSPDAQACAALFLEYVSDEESAGVLADLSKSTFALVRGGASFALHMRGFVGGRDELLGHLAFWLGRAKEPYERLICSNRLAVECGQGGIAAIVGSAAIEESPEVRCDMLYYLVRWGGPDVRRRVRRWNWNGQGGLGEALSFMMGAITPERSQDSMDNSYVELLRQLRSDGK